MTEPKKKLCDLCGKVVATKYGLLYTTENKYVTIRQDDITDYDSMEENTVKSKRHYCCNCFDKICKSLRKV